MKQFIASRLPLIGSTLIVLLAMMLKDASVLFGLIALAGVLLLPGSLLLRCLRVPRQPRIEWFLYSIALSLLSIMSMGLILNQLLPLFGVADPLTSAAVRPAMMGLIVALTALAAWRDTSLSYDRMWVKTITRRKVGLAAAFVVLPALSAVGADSLNNGGTSAYSMTMFSLIAAVSVVLVVWRRHVPAWLWGWAIFMMALAILWSNSLRGLYITGHDVQLEYYVYHLTSAHGRWAMANFRDAYNACLSITILPVMLQKFSGFDGIWLYKVAYQALFAVFTTGVFALSRRYTSRAVAFLATFVFLSFPTFLTDMPMLNRQEIAFGFFVVLLILLFDRRLAVWTRRTLAALAGVGLVLSHYSTTYVTIALLAGTYSVVLPWWLWLVSKQTHRRTSSQRRAVNLGIVLIIAASTFAWTGVYTKTGNNITHALTSAAKSIPGLTHSKSNTNISYAPVTGTKLTLQQQLNIYASNQQAAAAPIAAKQGGLISDSANYPLAVIAQATQPLTGVGHALSNIISPVFVENLAKKGYALALEGLILLGTLVVVIKRRELKLDIDFIILGPVGIFLLASETVLPMIDYGLFRMLQQDLVFLALPVVLGLGQLLSWLRVKSENWRLGIIACAFAAAFLFLSGVIPQLLGGSAGQLPLANNGFYYDAYYTNSADISTFAWLKTNYPAGYPINADMFTRMKIMANTGITTVDGITPSSLSRQSFVVLVGPNVTDDRVTLYLPSSNGQIVSYRYPTAFLDNNKNLIYSSSTTRVYQ